MPGGGRFDGVAGVVAALEIARALNEQGLDAQPRSRSDRLPRRGGERLRRVLRRLARPDGTPDAGDARARSRAARRLATGARPRGRRSAGHRGSRRSDVRRLRGAAHRAGPRAGERATRYRRRAQHRRHHSASRFWSRARADHAGTTPMALRADALCGRARRSILAIANESRGAAPRRARVISQRPIGVIEVAPNAANVVPASARLVVDARAERRRDDAAASPLELEQRNAACRRRRRNAPRRQLRDPVGLRRTPTRDARLCAIIGQGAHDCSACPGAKWRAGPATTPRCCRASRRRRWSSCHAAKGASHAPEEWAEPERSPPAQRSCLRPFCGSTGR